MTADRRGNEEIVREMLAAARESRYEDAREFLAADIEWHNTASFPGPRTVVGADDIFAFWRDLFASFDSQPRAKLERLETVGGLVVVGMHSASRGRGSGVPVEVSWAVTFALADDRIVRADVHGDYDTAVRAARGAIRADPQP